ncbi:hypothetical protein DFA_09801 [Cavenderia fasciculata]|uniref:Uncharacterized protein n=1 Tax=Cavenderia fasciculata TaxID=261658 RepID=F4QAR3_CACFS|nr:uncharacterized protein DFA_09801 [Cavenderia fasciculata]EGG14981.1 hypothetical protein DFA_09801 [Cavenderia fasciculata]|eukprot:XP_004351701.1 hypothetical protein DFA_09801 [Cavenderia fasciculata]
MLFENLRSLSTVKSSSFSLTSFQNDSNILSSQGINQISASFRTLDQNGRYPKKSNKLGN